MALLLLLGATGAFAGQRPPFFTAANGSGLDRTVATAPVTTANLFFADLGTNGRRCVTCHAPTDGWSITPSSVQLRFVITRGLDPLFRTNDGATSPYADVSTPSARRTAYSMLLSKALIRVGLGIPGGAEFALTGIDDPYGYASVSELSLFRRPLPSTNLRFLATLMWDGRETFPGQTMRFNLADQSNGATVGHAQGAPISQAVRDRIVDFETSLLTAQIIDHGAGPLGAEDAAGGPAALVDQPFWPGINSAQDPSGAAPTTRVFTIFDAWASAVARYSAARQSIARGQEIFNTRPFGTRGATCSGCHNAPNAGSNSLGLFFNLGLSDEARRTPDMPLYTLSCTAGALAGRTFRTTDPGRALVTGRCSDIGRFKAPTLRALASRPPYFHNGSAATLDAVVDFYDEHFGIGFTAEEKADLVAFLRAL